MGDMLSQAEIDALLGGSSNTDINTSPVVDTFTPDEKDALGEIGNISMGTAATTLFTLLGQKVLITTPKVNIVTWQDLAQGYDRPCVGIRVDYKEGLAGSNILILKETDVKIIANLMMGGDGLNITGELTELDLSAISEAMNQMAGSSSTSLSSMINRKIDIHPPNSFVIDFKDDDFFDNIGFGKDGLVCTSFRMEIGTLIDSEIMQVLPIDFAKEMVDTILYQTSSYEAPDPIVATKKEEPSSDQQPHMQQPHNMPEQQPYMQQPHNIPEQQPYMQQPYMQQPYMQQPYVQQPYVQQPYMQQPYMQQPYMQQPNMPQQEQPYMPPPPQDPQYLGQQTVPQNVNVQSAQFQNFDLTSVNQQKENMNIIMDVPLEVTVELGRTHKLIREILEFGPGTIIELDKLAGEPIDIYVNGKYVANGEVVVIDENFGIRITDIVSVDKRV